jgi:hypothetical protein
MPWLLLLLLIGARLAPAQSSPLPAKETLEYNIEWRLITAGKATIEWNATSAHGHAGSQVDLHMESVGLVSKLFKVDIDSSTHLNQNFCTESTLTSGREGNRRRETRVEFNAETHKANYQERDLARNTSATPQEIEIPECVHDVLGGIYYLRTLNLEPGQSIEVPVSDGKKSVMAKVEAQQREDVKLADGTYKAIRYEIYLFNNVLYRRPAHLYVWLTDDRRKLPVEIRVRAQITIGTITLLLQKHE